MSGTEPQHGETPSPLSAGRSRGAWVTLLTVTGAAIVIDLLTKYWAFMSIADRPVRVRREDVLQAEHPQMLIPSMESVVVVPRVLEFTLVLNEGAVFGLGAGGRWFFIFFTMLAILAVVVVFWRLTTARDHLAHAAIGLLIGGGLGNLYDRVRYASVRDFIHPLPDFWPYVSNVADLFLLIGIGGLMICFWRMNPEQSRGEVATDASRDSRSAGDDAETDRNE